MQFFINLPNALGRLRNTPHTDFHGRNGRKRSFMTFHFLDHHRASSEHKTGCQPVLCTDIAGNEIHSKNDSECTIMLFFLFHANRFFAHKFVTPSPLRQVNLPRSRLRATIPPGVRTLQSLPVTPGDLPRTTAGSVFLHCGEPGTSRLPSTGGLSLRTLMHNQGCQPFPRIGTPLPGYVPSSSPSSMVMRSYPLYSLLPSLVEGWSMTCWAFFLFRIADTDIGSYHAIRSRKTPSDPTHGTRLRCRSRVHWHPLNH